MGVEMRGVERAAGKHRVAESVLLPVGMRGVGRAGGKHWVAESVLLPVGMLSACRMLHDCGGVPRGYWLLMMELVLVTERCGRAGPRRGGALRRRVQAW